MEATDGSIIHVRGIDFCNNSIGEDLYVQTFFTNKLDSICKEVKRSSDRLSDASRYSNFLAFYHSYQARFNNWTATNNLVYTWPLAISDILNTIAGFDNFEPPQRVPLLRFTEERVILKTKHSGLGFRPKSNDIFF